MSAFVFRGPDGAETTTFDEAFFRSLILEGDAGYWSAQAGDAGVRVLDEPDRGEMVLVHAEGHGFLVQHRYEDEEDEQVVAHGDDRSARVRVWTGGDPWDVPAAFFCDRAQTWEIVRHVLTTGRRPEGLPWVSLWDGGWADG